jgi:hypothetical protein
VIITNAQDVQIIGILHSRSYHTQRGQFSTPLEPGENPAANDQNDYRWKDEYHFNYFSMAILEYFNRSFHH